MSEARVSASGVGRKRDPMIEPRVFAAAIRLYAREGWGGFTFEAIAREAGVGKPAIYRRWSSREEVLIAALDLSDFPTARDRGSVRADLVDYAAQWVEWYRHADRSLAAGRIRYDARVNPVLLAMYNNLVARPRVDAARAITRRAIKRGEIAATVPSSMMVDLLVGGMATHWEQSTEAGRARLRQTFPAYAESLVDAILSGVKVVSGQAVLTAVADAGQAAERA